MRPSAEKYVYPTTAAKLRKSPIGSIFCVGYSFYTKSLVIYYSLLTITFNFIVFKYLFICITSFFLVFSNFFFKNLFFVFV